ncbi:hypothetical protein SynPROS91_02106 [Synechococcus sp. PROS-9-1]|nr:hypothetical protein SynPROS91_02106 [Synechococcus sp. PROS-9-1]|tara:strand:+ start:1735 stop:1875 length:141 start_codon:yes stop_codon:yes gene_type:complete
MSLMEYVSGKKFLMLHHKSSCLAENKKANPCKNSPLIQFGLITIWA